MHIRLDQSYGRDFSMTPWLCSLNCQAVPDEIVALGLSVTERVTRCSRLWRVADHRKPINELIVTASWLLPSPPEPMTDIEILLRDLGLHADRRVFRIQVAPEFAANWPDTTPTNRHGTLQLEERLLDAAGRVFMLRLTSCAEGTITLVCNDK